MKSIRWISVFTLLALAAIPAFAQNWKSAASKACSTSGNDLYCLIDKSFAGQSAELAVTATLPGVTFRYDSWHSACGASSINPVEKKAFSLAQTGDSVTIEVLDPGPGITCRQLYITDCKANGSSIACSGAVSATAQTFTGNRQ